MSGIARTQPDILLIGDNPLAGHGCYNSHHHIFDDPDLIEDPITLEPITDPVTDECGHTFNRSSLDLIFRGATETQCPMSRRPIHIDRMVTNYALKSIIENQSRGNMSDTSPSLDSLANMMRQMMISQQSLMASHSRMETKIDLLDRKITIQGRQVNNVLNMSWCDKFGLVCGGDAREIINRGLSDDDIRLVNQPTTDEPLPPFANSGDWDASCPQPEEPVRH